VDNGYGMEHVLIVILL